MTEFASVEDLLAVLQLSDSSGETELADDLRKRFGVAPGDDLASALRSVPPGEVLAALTTAIAPVAAMVRELYEWLGKLGDVQSTANLTVRVTDAQLLSMNLDPARYEAYERKVLEEVSATEFDLALLPSGTPIFSLHDFHWKPSCLTGDVTKAASCQACRPSTAGDFSRLERLLRVASASIALSPQHAAHDDLSFFADRLPRWVETVTSRQDGRDTCPHERDYVSDYLRRGLPDLAGCFREVTVQQLKSFFELPYWKARWQVFELWTLSVVLDSYGTREWTPVLVEGVWNLKAGSTNPAPIATAEALESGEIRCYYQYESSPPAGLFPGTRDRPEMLVTLAERRGDPFAPGSAAEPVLLAVEAKARADYGPQEFKGAVFPLLEWRPRRILGMSYFPVTGADRLQIQAAGATSIGVAEAAAPGTGSAVETRLWLEELWRELPRLRITFVVADVSGSMPKRGAQGCLEKLTRTLTDDPPPGHIERILRSDLLLLGTFGGPPQLRVISELTAHEIKMSGLDFDPGKRSQDLCDAVEQWLDLVGRCTPRLREFHLHLITDGVWNDDDVAAFERCRQAGVEVRVHCLDDHAWNGRDELLPYLVTHAK
ncbi:vWA domain-containing protein [Amycolatopsis sp. NBC_00438]|uniref:vWA domain-containing protein n=1 Tax=Amycolatopsis sp. NBC_00438 TaxID=2903558 RepID=UPI002E1FFBD9